MFSYWIQYWLNLVARFKLAVDPSTDTYHLHDIDILNHYIPSPQISENIICCGMIDEWA